MKTHDLNKLTKNARAATECLKALAHETRLLAVCFICDGEKTVQELQDFLGTSQSNVSQHLAKLRDKGILDTRKVGNQVYYRIKDRRTLQIMKALCETNVEEK